jgi:hypothetical protein
MKPNKITLIIGAGLSGLLTYLLEKKDLSIHNSRGWNSNHGRIENSYW